MTGEINFMTYFLIVFIILLAFYSNRYGWWKKSVSYSFPRILMYHQISHHIKGAKFNGLRVPPEMFEKQISWLVEQGMHFVTMKQLLAYEDKIPEKTVAITFDDGYEDNYTYALKILKKYNACATLYLVVDRHDNDWSVQKKMHHNSGELARDKKLSDEQVKAMIDSGIFEIGAHTISHANSSQLSEEEKKEEICGSKNQLQKIFNIDISSFAYPFGIYDKKDVEIVKKCGFSSAVTTQNGINRGLLKAFELKRIKVSGKDNLYAFKLRLRTGMRGWKK